MADWKRYRESENDKYFWDGCLKVVAEEREVRPLPEREEDQHPIASNVEPQERQW